MRKLKQTALARKRRRLKRERKFGKWDDAFFAGWMLENPELSRLC